MELEQVPDAVYTGVDGIGIGTSLHYVDANKTIGALKPSYIREILGSRTGTMHSMQRGRNVIVSPLAIRAFLFPLAVESVF